MSPYKGLAPYEERDVGNFFGRAQETQILLGKIFSAHVTLFFAGTGVGKSSLLRAAVTPELTKQHNLDVVYYADWVQPPIAGLKAEIEKTLKANDKISGRELKGLDDLPAVIETCTAYASEPLVLIFDQFEELFRYQSRAGGQLLPFVNQLARVINAKELPLSVVLAIREDFLAELNIFKSKIPGLFDNYYRLERLTVKQARDAIEIPAQKLYFSYEAGLVDRILKDLTEREQRRADGASVLRDSADEPTRYVETPYLQIVCQKLWESEQHNPQKLIRAATYETLQGAEKIVRGHVEQFMRTMTLREQALAFRMFQHLVTPRGTKMAYQDEDLANTLGVPVAQVRPILERLAGRNVRVLRLDYRPPQEQWYELYHDVFADIIRAWTEEFREDENRHLYSQIISAAQDWQQHGQPDDALLKGGLLEQAATWAKAADHQNALRPDEQTFLKASLQKYQRGVWLRWGIVALIALIAIIAGGLAWYANGQRTTALQSAQKAYEAQQDAVRQKQAAEQQSRIALIRSLVAYALQDNIAEERERAALLARHAYLINQRDHGDVQKQIDDTLRTIFHTSAIVDGPGRDAAGAALSDLACQRLTTTNALSEEDWKEFVGAALPHELACPELDATVPLRLRQEHMVTEDRQALSLNLKENGRPIRDVVNQFDDWGTVIFDRATGLTWQKSGSSEGLTYQDAQTYVNTLNIQQYAGYTDWRLPTIEELLSLLEQEEMPIVPFFRLTADTLAELQNGEDPMPADVLAGLRPLQDRKFVAAADFFNALRERIAEAPLERYLMRILEQTKNEGDLYINPLFDSHQSWMWSSDLYQSKGEGSAEAVWYVDFRYGRVFAYSVNDHTYVRVVRSRQ